MNRINAEFEMKTAISAVILSAAILAPNSLAFAGEPHNIVGFGGVYLNKEIVDRLNRDDDTTLFRLALNRAYHRQFGAEALVRRTLYYGYAAPTNWEYDEVALDVMINDLSRFVQPR